MALDKAGLATAIESIMTDMRTKHENADGEYASRLADAIDAFVRTGQVVPGIAVVVGAPPDVQMGETTSYGTIN